MADKNNDKEIKELLHELALLEQFTGTGAEEMKDKLNEIIQKYSLNPVAVLTILARLAAGYIHIVQEHSAPEKHDEIEDKFHFMLESYLADLDLVKVSKTMEKIKRMDAN
ncbi:MAG: hypothetical protein IJ929_02045 [Prevotella sp.]|nr:hypothetical protein [Prevotella sp.]